MQYPELAEQLLEGCWRLAARKLLSTSKDSFSLRVPDETKMVLVSAVKDWCQAETNDICAASFATADAVSRVHAAIYEERGDVGAIVISAPPWTQLLCSRGESLPPLFDEQVRHIGPPARSTTGKVPEGVVAKAFRQGANAALLRGRLICLGMTRDRVLFNLALYEKCAQAFTLARASGSRVKHIPAWVRLIATRRLLKDQEAASMSYREGRTPAAITAY